MTTNTATATVPIHDQCNALVKDFILFQSAYALREEAEATLKDIRPKIVETLKSLKKSGKVWKDLKSEFAAAIADAKMADPAKKLEVIKLCYEHGILPSDWNSTRLKKAPTVLNWAGIRIPNPELNKPMPYKVWIAQHDALAKAVHGMTVDNMDPVFERVAAFTRLTDALPSGRTRDMALPKLADLLHLQAGRRVVLDPSLDEDAVEIAASTPAQAAPAPAPANGTGTITALLPQKTPAKKAGKAGKTDADGTGSESAVTPFELFQTRFTAFTRDEVTPHYVKTLAALLKVEPAALTAAMTAAYSDLCTQAAQAARAKS